MKGLRGRGLRHCICITTKALGATHLSINRRCRLLLTFFLHVTNSPSYYKLIKGFYMHSACVMNIKNKKFDFAIADIFLRETRKQVQFFLSIFIVLELHYENRFSFMF